MRVGTSVSVVVLAPKAGRQREKADIKQKIDKILVERGLILVCVLFCSLMRTSQPRNGLRMMRQAECRDSAASSSP